MPPVGLEPTISADERMQTCAFDGAATGTSLNRNYLVQYSLPLGHILSQLNPFHTFIPDDPI